MIEECDAVGKSVAAVLMDTTSQADEPEAAWVFGVLTRSSQEWILVSEDHGSLPLPHDTLERLSRADADPMFRGADYYIVLRVGKLPDDWQSQGYQRVDDFSGKWPSSAGDQSP